MGVRLVLRLLVVLLTTTGILTGTLTGMTGTTTGMTGMTTTGVPTGTTMTGTPGMTMTGSTTVGTTTGIMTGATGIMTTMTTGGMTMTGMTGTSGLGSKTGAHTMPSGHQSAISMATQPTLMKNQPEVAAVDVEAGLDDYWHRYTSQLTIYHPWSHLQHGDIPVSIPAEVTFECEPKRLKHYSNIITFNFNPNKYYIFK